MRPFVVNGHGRLVFPSNFSAELDFSVLETLEQLEAVVKRDFEAKAPTGTEILERVESGAYDSRVPAAARPRDEPGLGQPLRDDDVREASDAMARPSAPPRRRLPAAADAVGGRASARSRPSPTAWSELSRRRGTPRPRTGSSRACSRSSATSATTRPSCRPSSRPWTRSRATRRNLTLLPPAPRPRLPDLQLRGDPRLQRGGPRARAAAPPRDGAPQPVPVGPGARARLEEVGKIGDDDFVVAFVPRNPEVLEFIRRVRGAAPRRARGRRRPPRRATPVAPLPPTVVREQFALMPRLESLAVVKGEHVCTQRGHRPQRRLQLVADDGRTTSSTRPGSGSGATPSAGSSTSPCRRRTRRSRARGGGRRRSAR